MPEPLRYPRLLNAGLQEERRLMPSALSLNLKRRAASEADITLDGADAALPMLAFVEVYLRRGSAGLYRVVERKRALESGGSRSYTLRHAICTLSDSVWRAQEDFSGTVATFLARLLHYQTVVRWRLGTVSDTGQYKRSNINYEHLDDLLWELAEDRQDFLFTFDFSTSPWTLNFVAASGAVDCEMRPARNLLDGDLRESRDGMCNRLYLTVHSTRENDDYEESYIEPTTSLIVRQDTASQALFGVIEGTADIDTADVPDVNAWVAAFFRDRAAPLDQTSSEGWEIVKTTGEPFDQFDLGKKCRVPALEAEGPVEGIRFPNLLADPDKAKIDLKRRLPRFSENLKSLKEKTRVAASSARGAGYAAKRNKADNDGLASYIHQTDREIRLEVYAADSRLGSYISQTATSLTTAVYNAESNMASYVIQTATAIRSEIYAAESQLGSYISQTATSLTAAVYNAESNMASYITQTASEIRAELYAADSRLGSYVSQTATSITQAVYNAESGLRASISTQADRISLVVEGTGASASIKAAQIVAGINNSGSSVIISADHINLNGYVKATDITADFIASKVAEISMLNVKALNVNSSAGITAGGNGWFTDGIRIGSGSTFTSCLVSASVSGNTLTLTNSSGGTVTFSKATSLSGEWSGSASAGKSYKVTASPQGTVHYSPSIDGIVFLSNTKSWDSDYKGFTQTFEVYDSNSVTVYRDSYYFGTSQSYNAGYNDGQSSFTQYGSGSTTLYYKNAENNYVAAGTHVWYYA